MASPPSKSSAKAPKSKAAPHDRSDGQASQPKTTKPNRQDAQRDPKKPAARGKRGGAAASTDQLQAGKSAIRGPHKPEKPRSTRGPATTSAPPELTPWQQWSADPLRAISHLCDDIVQGGNLWAYCQKNGISYGSIRNWLAADPEREAKYARAREDRSDKLADEIVAISDEASLTTKVSVDGEETLALDPTAVARNRLRVDARKWVASKLKPRVYGDKMAVGGDPDAPPIQHNLAVRFVNADTK